MSSSVVIFKSYNKNSKTITGSFPIWTKGVSICCIDNKGNQTSTPITIKQ